MACTSSCKLWRKPARTLENPIALYSIMMPHDTRHEDYRHAFGKEADIKVHITNTLLAHISLKRFSERQLEIYNMLVRTTMAIPASHEYYVNEVSRTSRTNNIDCVTANWYDTSFVHDGTGKCRCGAIEKIKWRVCMIIPIRTSADLATCIVYDKHTFPGYRWPRMPANYLRMPLVLAMQSGIIYVFPITHAMFYCKLCILFPTYILEGISPL